MGHDSEADSENGITEDPNWPRRSVLKVSGVGAGLAALGGVSLAAGSDESGEETVTETYTETENGAETTTATPASEDGVDDGGGGALVDDLIDPVFGYPLAEDETEDVDVDSVVELFTEEGEGAHPNFPVDPQSGDPVPFEFAFDPVGIRVEPGTVIEFDVRSGEHTVTAIHERFSLPQRAIPMRVPDGTPAFTSPPVVDGQGWLYQFPASGVYDILCLPHFSFGMVMRVVVFDSEEDDIESDTFSLPAIDGLPLNPRQVLTAEELDPADVVDAGAVRWADLTIEVPQTATPGGEIESTPGTDTETPPDTETEPSD